VEADVFVRALNEFHHLVDTRLHNLDSWTRGHFAEALVVSLLDGAVVAEHGVAPCDVTWGAISIAVRTTGSRSTDHIGAEGRAPFAGSWKFPPKMAWDPDLSDWSPEPPRRCWADVAVLAFHDGFEIAHGWGFYVLSQTQVETFPSVTLTPRNLLAAGFLSVSPEMLAVQIRKAAVPPRSG